MLSIPSCARGFRIALCGSRVTSIRSRLKPGKRRRSYLTPLPRLTNARSDFGRSLGRFIFVLYPSRVPRSRSKKRAIRASRPRDKSESLRSTALRKDGDRSLASATSRIERFRCVRSRLRILPMSGTPSIADGFDCALEPLLDLVTATKLWRQSIRTSVICP